MLRMPPHIIDADKIIVAIGYSDTIIFVPKSVFQEELLLTSKQEYLLSHDLIFFDVSRIPTIQTCCHKFDKDGLHSYRVPQLVLAQHLNLKCLPHLTV